MIVVDIIVPCVNKTYDFSLNEQIPVHAVIDEISEMIGQKERSKIAGDIRLLQLYEKKKQKLLDKNKTLKECGVQTGCSLIFV